MKYKVGDIVKLRDDLEIDENYGGTVFTVLTHKLKHQGIKIIKVGTDYYIVEGENKIIAYASDEMIEGLWEECKSTEQVSKSECKYKLIDVLNKIANGELKEGTKVKMGEHIYDVEIFSPITPLDKEFLNTEVELIEPHHFRDDTKLIEPTDNTKIEELDILEIEDSQNIDNIGLANSIGDLRNEIREIQHKLNEVIRYINK